MGARQLKHLQELIDVLCLPLLFLQGGMADAALRTKEVSVAASAEALAACLIKAMQRPASAERQ